jgi:hypothetical protein
MLLPDTVFPEYWEELAEWMEGLRCVFGRVYQILSILTIAIQESGEKAFPYSTEFFGTEPTSIVAAGYPSE